MKAISDNEFSVEIWQGAWDENSEERVFIMK